MRNVITCVNDCKLFAFNANNEMKQTYTNYFVPDNKALLSFEIEVL